MGSRFILTLVMAKYMGAEELGIYGLVSVTIGISLYFLGMDFYTFSAREMLARPREDIPLLIRDQCIFHGLTYTVMMPLLLLVFAADFIPWKYIFWFYILLILEHISQETYRLLITISRPVVANTVFFFRFGAWAYIVGGMAVFTDSARSLGIILMSWALGELISLIIAGFYLKDLAWQRLSIHKIDWFWIRSGFKTSGFFFWAQVL